MTIKKEVGIVNKAILKYFKQLNNRYYKTIPNINNGYCGHWALIFHKLFGGRIYLHVAHHHAFIKKDNKYYDAQTPDGVEDWIDIKGLRKLRKALIGIRKAGVSDDVRMITESQLKDDFGQIKKSDILLIMSFVKK